MSMQNCLSCNETIDTDKNAEHFGDCTIETGICSQCGGDVQTIRHGNNITYECLLCGDTIET